MVHATSAVTFAVIALNAASVMAFPMDNMDNVNRVEPSNSISPTEAPTMTTPDKLPTSSNVVGAPGTIPTTTITALPIATPCRKGEKETLQLVLRHPSVSSPTTSYSPETSTAVHSAPGGDNSTNPGALDDATAFPSAVPPPSTTSLTTSSSITSSSTSSSSTTSTVASSSTPIPATGDTVAGSPVQRVTTPAATTTSAHEPARHTVTAATATPAHEPAGYTAAAATETPAHGPIRHTATAATTTSAVQEPPVYNTAALPSIPTTLTHTGVDGKPTATVYLPPTATFCYNLPPDPTQQAPWDLGDHSKPPRKSTDLLSSHPTRTMAPSLTSTQPSKTTSGPVDPKLVARATQFFKRNFVMNQLD